MYIYRNIHIYIYIPICINRDIYCRRGHGDRRLHPEGPARAGGRARNLAEKMDSGGNEDSCRIGHLAHNVLLEPAEPLFVTVERDFFVDIPLVRIHFII